MRRGKWAVGTVVSLSLLGPGVRLGVAGQVTATWDQAMDCAVITGWELRVAPITLAQPNPVALSATLGASIANTGTPTCGLAMAKTVTVPGVGAYRFWMRALAGAVASADSGSVDASIPLGKPSGLHVAGF